MLAGIVSCFWIAALRLIRPAVESNAELWQSVIFLIGITGNWDNCQYPHKWVWKAVALTCWSIILVSMCILNCHHKREPASLQSIILKILNLSVCLSGLSSWSWHVHIPDKNKWSRQREIIMDSSQEIDKEMGCPHARTVGRKSLFVQSTDGGVTEYL